MGLRLAAAVAAVMAFLLLALLIASAAIKMQFDLEHSFRADMAAAYEYRTQLRTVLSDLQDAETGQRGYLLTGKETYLTPYFAALNRIDVDIKGLNRPGPAADYRVADELEALQKAKFAELSETIALKREGKLGDALTVVQSDRGQRLMDRARAISASERLRLASQIARWSTLADASAKSTERFALVLGLLMTAILGIGAALIGHTLTQRRRTIGSLAIAHREVSALLKTFALAERVSASGHWSLASNGGHHWSPGVFAVFGLPAAEHPPPVEDVIAHYTEADRVIVREQVERGLRDRVGFSFEADMSTPAGERKQIQVEADYVEELEGGTLIGVVRDITLERTAQQALEQSEQRYRLLAENSTDMIITMERDFTITFISPVCSRILGYELSQLIGRTTLSIMHPEDVAPVLATFEGVCRAGADGVTNTYRFRGRHQSGAWIWLEGQPRVEFEPTGNAIRFQDVVREISSRKAAEEALEASRSITLESERRYRLLAENATDVIWRYTVAGEILYVSPACREVLGFNPEDLVGRNTIDLVHPDDRERIRGQLETRKARQDDGATLHTENRSIRKDGREIWLEGRPRPVRDAAGRVIEFQDVMRDITARKHMEAELEAALTAASAAARSKADFLANMSHELRTPLNSVVGFSGLIADAPELSAETRRRATVIRDSSRTLVSIVNDILDFSKFEAEGVSLNPKATDLCDLLSSTLDLMQQQADSKGLSLNLETTGCVEAVMVDPVRLRQVLFNLLGNAIKFTERGTVLVTLQDVGGAVSIRVSDTGIGIPPDRIARIFDRFAQADASISRRYGGTGLGLAICNSIAKAMGGQLSVSSSVGLGSTFTLLFDPPRVAVRSPAAPPRVKPASSVAGLRVLVADDNTFNQDLFEALTEGRGLLTTYVSNGEEAVQAVAEHDYDLVFMDMQMPVMDGVEATRAIRAAGLDKLPIVALTANVVESQIELCREAGMDDHLAKPYTAKAALAMVARWTIDRASAAA